MTFGYDPANRIVTKGCPSCGAGFNYDNEGNLLGVTDVNAGTFAFAYDALDRVIQSTQPNSQVVQYAYDAIGLRNKLTYPDQASITYQYDSVNRLVGITDGDEKYTFQYDDAGRRVALTYPNKVKTTYAYDNADRLTQLLTKDPASKLISQFDYMVDAMGNWTQMTQQIPGTKKANQVFQNMYGYDSLDRLTGVSQSRTGISQNYSYDAVGNRTSKIENSSATSYAANNLNQYIQVGSQALSYDARGNLTSDNVLSMTYDTDNRLTKVVNGATTVSYLYDWSNRLMQKTVQEGKITTKTRYVYDGWTVIAETNENGKSAKKKYVIGPRVDEILTQKGDNTLYLTRDGLGSTREVSNGSGDVSQRYDYDAFGVVTVLNAKGDDKEKDPKTNYLFTGRELQEETGLYNYRNRFYHPTLGRFVQRDPIGFLANDVNVYNYVGGSPISFVDPMGLQQVTFSQVSGPVFNPYPTTVFGNYGQPFGANSGSFNTNANSGTSSISVNEVSGSGGSCNTLAGQQTAGQMTATVSGPPGSTYNVNLNTSMSLGGTGNSGGTLNTAGSSWSITANGSRILHGRSSANGTTYNGGTNVSFCVTIPPSGSTNVATFSGSSIVSGGNNSGNSWATATITVHVSAPGGPP